MLQAYNARTINHLTNEFQTYPIIQRPNKYGDSLDVENREKKQIENIVL